MTSEGEMTTLDLDIYDEKYAKLCKLYWQIEPTGEFTFKVAEIADETGIKKSSIPRIVKNSCVAYSSNSFCEICESPREFTSRSEYQSVETRLNWVCPSCMDESQLSLDDKKRRLIEGSLRIAKGNPVKIDDMGFKHAAFLLALIRYSANEDLTQIQALVTNRTDLLTPERDYDLQIVRELYHAGIIAISPLSPLEAIELKEEGGFVFYLNQVVWEVPLSADDSLPGVVSRIESKLVTPENIVSEYDSVKELCEELCLLECLAYLNYVVDDHKLSFKVGEKTKLVLSGALQNFTVAQIYNFIWRAGKDAAAFYMRSGVPRTHAANTIVGSIQKQCERALANGWDVKPFHRNFNMPQSIISQVVFNLALRSDDGGFHKKLAEII